MGIVQMITGLVGGLKDAIINRLGLGKKPDVPKSEDNIAKLKTLETEEKKVVAETLLKAIEEEKRQLTEEYSRRMDELEAKEKEILREVPELSSAISTFPKPQLPTIPTFKPPKLPTQPTVEAPEPAARLPENWIVELGIEYTVYKDGEFLRRDIGFSSLVTRPMLRNEVEPYIYSLIGRFIGETLESFRDSGYIVGLPYLRTGESTAITAININSISSGRGEESRMAGERVSKEVIREKGIFEGYREKYGQQDMSEE